MVNDAQLKSPPKSDVHGAIRTDNDVNIDRGVKILEYKVISDDIQKLRIKQYKEDTLQKKLNILKLKTIFFPNIEILTRSDLNI